jgi:hypothetical protein
MRQADPRVLACSFCLKSQDSVSKLISSPSQYPRAYICNECIAVCVAILGDDSDPAAAVWGTPATDEKHPLLAHPLVSSLLTAVEQWIRRESLGGDAVQEFAQVRRIAELMVE